METYLKDKVVLPKQVIDRLYDESKPRVDGFMLIPFVYENQTVKKVPYDEKFIFKSDNILNNSVNMVTDYRARISNDLIHGNVCSAGPNDAHRLMQDYSIVMFQGPIVACQPAFDASSGIFQDNRCLFSPNEDSVEVIIEPVAEERLADLRDVEIDDPGSNVVNDKVTGEALSNASADDGRGSSVSDKTDEEQKEDTNLCLDLKNSWAAMTAIPPQNPPQIEDEGSHIQIFDFLYHAQIFEYKHETIMRTKDLIVVQRKFSINSDNNPKKETGALHSSLTYHNIKNNSQFSVYIVFSEPDYTNRTSTEYPFSGGYQIGLIVPKEPSYRLLDISYARCQMNMLTLIEQVKQKDVKFFSREFGSFHNCGYLMGAFMEPFITQLRKDFNKRKNGEFDIFSKVDEFLSILKIRFMEINNPVRCSLIINRPSLSTKYVPNIQKAIKEYEAMIFGSRNLRPEDIECIKGMINEIAIRSGRIHGSRINRISNALFKVPCGGSAVPPSEYDTHLCTVRQHARAIVSRYDLFHGENFSLNGLGGYYCVECFRLYDLEFNALLCTYFCLNGLKHCCHDLSVRSIDSYGRRLVN